MANKADKEKQKQIQEKCQTILCQLLREEDNKYCVDCDAKGPRWASWNLGIFLCIRCAGIHRNLGVHISKVKSVNLDTWTPEQVGLLQEMGNSRARAIYEANLPDNFSRPRSDSLLETFVRDKYEHKRFIAKEWVPLAVSKLYKVEDEKIDRKQHKSKAVQKVENLVLQQPIAVPRPHGTTNINTITRKTTSSPKPQTQQSSTEESSVDLLCLDVPRTDTAPVDLWTDTASVDLLGLGVPKTDTTNDLFDCLVSGTTAASNPINDVQSTGIAEKDFFSQEAPVEPRDKIILTKESILSLYTSGSTNGSWPSFGTSGMYALQPMYQTNTMMGGNPSGGVLSTSNRMIGFPLQNNCVPQTVPSTNPFGSLGIGPQGGAVWNRGLSNPVQGTPRLGQIQNQMASLQLQGQAWNMMGNIQNPCAEHINSGPSSLGAPQPAPTLYTSLWH